MSNTKQFVRPMLQMTLALQRASQVKLLLVKYKLDDETMKKVDRLVDVKKEIVLLQSEQSKLISEISQAIYPL